MLNRSAVVVRYRQPFVDWVNSVEPDDETLTLESINEDTSVYLVEVEDEDEFEEWLELNYDLLFEELLGEWYTDASLWPDDRSLSRFKQWCTLEFHSLVFDTGGEEPLEDDDDRA